MALIVVGSVAFDSVETPYGKAENVLGGSATYFSIAASFFTSVRLVAVVGRDFPEALLEIFRRHGVDLSGLERSDGLTFRWSGSYTGDMNVAETRSCELNVLGNFHPKLPADYRGSGFCFLANCAPAVQMEVIHQLTRPQLVVCDTMNHWIADDKKGVESVLRKVNGVVLNDAEARMFAGTENLPRAASHILEFGPSFVVVKKGEHGAMLATREGIFFTPAYPTRSVVDPTGAGDSFAGGLMGYLARAEKFDFAALRRAMVYGTVAASINVEGFSLERLDNARYAEIEERSVSLIGMMTVS